MYNFLPNKKKQFLVAISSNFMKDIRFSPKKDWARYKKIIFAIISIVSVNGMYISIKTLNIKGGHKQFVTIIVERFY